MRKVLIVAYYFPPHATVGSLRPLGFCRYLHKFGWLPHVVSTDMKSVYPPCPSEDSLCQSLPENVIVDRIPYFDPNQSLLKYRERIRRLLGVVTPRPGDQEEKKHSGGSLPVSPCVPPQSSWMKIKKFILDWAFDFPDQQHYWFHSVKRKIARIPSKDYPDLVFATGGPWTGLLVGRALARRFRVPFVADFRDPWMSVPSNRRSSQLLTRRLEKLEAAVCASAAAVVLNTEEMRQNFIDRYPDVAHKFVAITNGFNFGSETYQDAAQSESYTGLGGTYELCHFGNVYGGRNATSLFQAVMELHRESRLHPHQFRLRFIGSLEIEDIASQELIKYLEQEGFLRCEPPLPHRLCLQEMAAAHTLLILQPHSAVRIPAKTYEYIASGRPIILIGEEGAASHLIERHRLGRWCQDGVPAIKTLIAEIVAGETKINPPAREDTRRFEYSVLTNQLSDVFDKVMLGEAVSGVSSPKT